MNSKVKMQTWKRSGLFLIALAAVAQGAPSWAAGKKPLKPMPSTCVVPEEAVYQTLERQQAVYSQPDIKDVNCMIVMEPYRPTEKGCSKMQFCRTTHTELGIPDEQLYDKFVEHYKTEYKFDLTQAQNISIRHGAWEVVSGGNDYPSCSPQIQRQEVYLVQKMSPELHRKTQCA